MKDERSIIKQLVKRGIIGDFSTSRMNESRTFVEYDKSVGLIKTFYSCDVLPSRYQYYDADTFELVLSRNVVWDETPRFDNNQPEGWDIHIFNISNFVFADALMNIFNKGVM